MFGLFFFFFFIIFRYQKRCDELELMCRSYGEQFETLLKDKHDISSYLKKQLESRDEQVFDLHDRLIGLQQAKDKEQNLYENNFKNMKEEYQMKMNELEQNNMLLSN